MWLNAISKVYLVNLQKRTDRLIKSAEQFEKYEIPFTVFPAIENSHGGLGLRDTMVKLFRECVESGYNSVLVFEDDVMFVEDPVTFHDTMNKAIAQLPDNYLLFYMGGQATAGYSHFHSPNLLPAIKYYATHAVMYSRRAMITILSMDMGFPIDNFLVDTVQPMGSCYAINPILCSQYEGFSDIGQSPMNWDIFIRPKHEEAISKIPHHAR